MRELLARLTEIISALAVLAALVMTVWHRRPLVELFTNLRPQILLSALAVLVVGLALSSRIGPVAAALAVLLLAPSTLPYVMARPKPIDTTQATVRALQFNIQFTNLDTDAIAAEVLRADADVVALHEVTDAHWPALQRSLRGLYPHVIADPADPEGRAKGQGIALLSRTPLHRISIDTRYPQSPVAATTEILGAEVLVLAVHPSPSRTDVWLIEQRERFLDVSSDVVRAHEGPALILTDLNVTPTSPVYGEFLDELGWDDPRRRFGMEPTYPTGRLNPLGIAIDHIFVSPELTVGDYELGGSGGSDHRSLTATITTSADH